MVKAATALAFLVLVFASYSLAQCNPDWTISTCTLSVVKNDACRASVGDTIVWCPDGDMSYFEVEATLLASSGTPCPYTAVYISIYLKGEPSAVGNNIFACGFSPGGTLDSLVITDANGKATVGFWGGGCGCLNIYYRGELAIPPIGLYFGIGQQDFCVKSPDFNGDGNINFFDIFQYLPCLGGTFCECADFTCDGVITFFDTFQLLPHLGGAHSCSGSAVPYRACATTGICF